MMGRKVNCISAATLLHEKWQRKLHDYLRPMANDHDIVWQQMTFENFTKLMLNKQLYLRAYGEYSDYDEMKLADFIEPNLKGDNFADIGNVRRELEKSYRMFEKKLFISCWYNSPDLSDVVFKTYAKGDSGIAVGTYVRDVRSLFGRAWEVMDDVRNIVCANVQYVPQIYMGSMELFELAQVYAPVFMKGLQFKMDNEFRVCVEKNRPEELNYNSETILDKVNKCLVETASKINAIKPGDNVAERIGKIETEYHESNKTLYNGVVPSHMYINADPKNFVKFIAIKDDSLFQKLKPVDIIDFFKRCFTLETDASPEINGFTVYKVK